MAQENSKSDAQKESKVSKSSYWNAAQVDGKIKEAILLEEHTRDIWQRRWGYMLDYWKILDNCSQKFGLSKDRVHELNPCRKRSTIQMQCNQLQIKKYPKTSSGVIGWHSLDTSNKGLEYIGGPQYISPESTFCPLTETHFYKKKQYILYIG